MKFKEIAVLAGNFEQANYIIRKFKKKGYTCNFFYISEYTKALGLDFDDYIIYGTFWERRDADKIYDEVRSRLNPDGGRIDD